MRLNEKKRQQNLQTEKVCVERKKIKECKLSLLTINTEVPIRLWGYSRPECPNPASKPPQVTIKPFAEVSMKPTHQLKTDSNPNCLEPCQIHRSTSLRVNVFHPSQGGDKRIFGIERSRNRGNHHPS